MNSLSWFIYLIDVLFSFEKIASVLLFLSVSYILVGGLAAALIDEDSGGTEALQLYYKVAKTWVASTIVICLLSIVLIPTKNTMYMIGASQAAEFAIETPEVTKVLTILNNKLDEIVEKSEVQKEQTDSE